MTASIPGLEAQGLFNQAFGSETAQPAQDMVDRFQQMMANAAPQAHVASSPGETIVSKVLTEQDAAFHTVPNDMLSLMKQPVSSQENPLEAMERVTNEQMYVSSEMAQMSANLSMDMALTKSSKGSVETLMKNQ